MGQKKIQKNINNKNVFFFFELLLHNILKTGFSNLN